MSMRKASRFKVVDGTHRPRRAKAQAGPLRCGKPKMPTDISKGAAEHWDHFANVLMAHQVLTPHHERPLREICETVALIDQLRRHVAKHGAVIGTTNTRGDPKSVSNPAVGLLLQAKKTLFNELAHFGLTPRSIGTVELFEPAAAKRGTKARKSASGQADDDFFGDTNR